MTLKTIGVISVCGLGIAKNRVKSALFPKARSNAGELTRRQGRGNAPLYTMTHRSVEYLNTTLHGTDWAWTPKQKLAILEIPKGANKGVLYFWNPTDGKSEVSFDITQPPPEFTINEAEVIAFCRPLRVQKIQPS